MKTKKPAGVTFNKKNALAYFTTIIHNGDKYLFTAMKR